MMENAKKMLKKHWDKCDGGTKVVGRC